MAYNRPGVAHGFAKIGQHVNVVPQLTQAGNAFGAEAALQLERVGSLPPGAPQQPARPGAIVVVTLAVEPDSLSASYGLALRVHR